MAATLARAGIRDLRDLLLFFPRRLQDVLVLDAPGPEALDRLVRLPGRVDHVRLAWLRGPVRRRRRI